MRFTYFNKEFTRKEFGKYKIDVKSMSPFIHEKKIKNIGMDELKKPIMFGSMKKRLMNKTAPVSTKANRRIISGE